jgi:O-antigen/teichoic acid export membrane protein
MLKKENFIFLVFSIFSMCIGIFSTYLLSSEFTIEDFGRIQLLITFVGFFSIFSLPGLDVIIQKQIYIKEDSFVLYTLKRISPFSFLLLIITALIAYLNMDVNSDLIIPAAIIASFNIFDKTNAILNAKLEFKVMRYLEIITRFAFCFVVIISVYMGLDLYVYIVIYTAFSAFIVVGRIFYSKKFLINNQNFNYKHLIKEGMNTTYSSSYITLANYSEKLILGYLDMTQLAIFSIGQLFPKLIKDNIKIMLTPTLNVWASRGFIYYKKMILKNEFFLWALGIIFYIVLYFMVELVIKFFFIKYESSIVIAQLLSLTIIFKFVENVKMSSMALSQYTSVFNGINNVVNTLKIILVLCFVYPYGMYGAVFSILMTDCIRFIIITRKFKKL